MPRSHVLPIEMPLTTSLTLKPIDANHVTTTVQLAKEVGLCNHVITVRREVQLDVEGGELVKQNA